MSDVNEQSRLAEKLSGPVSAIIDKHRHTIAPMLFEGGGVTRAALQNDAAVRTVAGYCYLMLPGLLRLAIREPTFVDFVMSHREKLLARLVEQPLQN
jgi:hypothetical protein